MALITGIGGATREVIELPCGVDGVLRDTEKAYCGVEGVKREVFNSNHNIITGTMPKYYSDTNCGYMPTPSLSNRVISYPCPESWYGSMIFDFGSMDFTNINSITLNFDRYATNTAMCICVANVTRSQGEIWSDHDTSRHPLRNFKIRTLEKLGTETTNINHAYDINGIPTPAVDKTIVCDTSAITGNGYLVIANMIGTKVISGTINLKSIVLGN